MFILNETDNFDVMDAIAQPLLIAYCNDHPHLQRIAHDEFAFAMGGAKTLHASYRCDPHQPLFEFRAMLINFIHALNARIIRQYCREELLDKDDRLFETEFLSLRYTTCIRGPATAQLSCSIR